MDNFCDKRTEWIHSDNAVDGQNVRECSNCGQRMLEVDGVPMPKKCPSCGRLMIKEESEE